MNRSANRIVIVAIGFRTLLGWSGGLLAAERQAEPPPNLIFVLADDLGYGDLGCYGQQRIKTPQLDRLAAEGLRFTQHYAGSTVCAPSRCVLLTGLHTGHCEIRGNRDHSPTSDQPLSAQAVTLADVLQAAGYATAVIGKWGLGDQATSGFPHRQGFDESYGFLEHSHAHNHFPAFLFRNGQRQPLRNIVPNAGPSGAGDASLKQDYAQDLFLQEARQWVRNHAEQPFFLYLALNVPHANNEAKPNGQQVPDEAPYAAEPWPAPQRGTAAMITRIDRQLGELRTLLAELELTERTLIIFTSDNGPHAEGGADPAFFNSAGGLRGHKRALYEGGIRVPLIAHWPGHIAPGTTSNHLSGFQDWLPTFAELAGAPPTPGVDGLSLVPTLLAQGPQPQHEYLYWEFYEEGGKQALRSQDWKAVRLDCSKPNPPPLELYNLATDPAESQNVAAANPEIVKKLTAAIQAAHTDSPLYQFTSEPRRNASHGAPK